MDVNEKRGFPEKKSTKNVLNTKLVGLFEVTY